MTDMIVQSNQDNAEKFLPAGLAAKLDHLKTAETITVAEAVEVAVEIADGLLEGEKTKDQALTKAYENHGRSLCDYTEKMSVEDQILVEQKLDEIKDKHVKAQKFAMAAAVRTVVGFYKGNHFSQRIDSVAAEKKPQNVITLYAEMANACFSQQGKRAEDLGDINKFTKRLERQVDSLPEEMIDDICNGVTKLKDDAVKRKDFEKIEYFRKAESHYL